MAAARRIETARLLLRPFQEADLDAYAAMCADPQVMRFLGGEAWTRPQAWRHLAYMVGHWQLRGFGLYALIEKAGGAFAGRVGFIQPEGWPGFEVGWALARQHWGRGLASEAAAACVQHAFEALERSEVISLIHPDNKPSRRVAERIGERHLGAARIPGFDGDLELWGIDAASWRAA